MALTSWSGGVAALGAAALFVLGDVAGATAQTIVKLAHAVSTQDPYQYGSLMNSCTALLRQPRSFRPGGSPSFSMNSTGPP